MEQHQPEAPSSARPSSMDGAERPSKGPILLITTVDIGGGRSDKIELRQGDVPVAVARLFCLAHSIPDTVIPPLTEHIKDNLRKAGIALDEVTGAAKGAPMSSRAGSQHQAADQLGSGMEAGHAAPPAPEEGPQCEDISPPLSGKPHPAAQHHELHYPPVTGAAAAQKLSFEHGMNDRLYEQLSQKLLPVDDNSRLLSVSTSLAAAPASRPGTSHKALSLASADRPYRKSQSAEGSPSHRVVHNRLYKQAQDQRARQEARRRACEQELLSSLGAGRASMSWISQEMMRDRSQGPFDNYGEMLYAEGLEAAAQRKAKADAVLQARAAHELDGVTFMPEITQLAAALWAGDELDAQPAWQRLSANKRSKTLERIHEMKAAKEQAELKDCTFQPRINRNSASLMAERSEAQRALRLTAHEQLYADARRRQQKMESLKTWLPDSVTFQPAVNKGPAAAAALQRSLDTLGVLRKSTSADGSAPGMCGGSLGSARGGPSSPGASSSLGGGAISVVDRLYMSFEKTKARLEEKRAVLHGDVDPDTGRPLFHPEVGRGPRNGAGRPGGSVASRDSAAIGEYLYCAGLDFLSRKEHSLEAVRAADREAANTVHSTSRSQKLYDQLRAKRFTQIFEYLDAGSAAGLLDVVGLVRAPTQQVDNLDTEVREDVEAAAQLHARACGVPLLPPEGTPNLAAATAALPPCPPVDLAAFVGLMEEALRRRRKPRAYLVPTPPSKQAPSHTFQPAINKRSKELASRMRPADLAAHDLLHHSARVTQARLEAARRAAEDAELAECTFAPSLNPMMGHEVVEGRAIRAARAAVAAGAAIRASRLAGASEQASPAGTAAPPPSGRATATGTLREQQRQQQLALTALEQEVQDALDGVEAANARLGALEQQTQQQLPVTSSVSVHAGGGLSEASPKGYTLAEEEEGVDGFGRPLEPNARDLRATEAMLLEMLAASPNGLDSSADEAVIDQLHALFVEAPQGGSSGAVHVTAMDPHAAQGSKGGAGAGVRSLRKRSTTATSTPSLEVS